MKALHAPCVLASMVLATTLGAEAMTMRVVRDQAILSGPLIPSDVEQFRRLLEANPSITTVVLADSRGGAFIANRGLTNLIQDRKLNTAVSGHCVSACAMVFLSGKERYFSDGERLESTSLGFHGSYEDGQLAPEERLRFLKGVVAKETGGKADPALVDHWLHLADQRSTVRFRYPGEQGSPPTATVFDCRGPGPNRGDYTDCTPLTGFDALSMGIITSTVILHVATSDK